MVGIRQLKGLLLRGVEAFQGDPEWSLEQRPRFTTYPLSTALLGPTAASADAVGIREGQLFIDDDATWVLLYDAGNGTTGWRSFYATSTDRGLTWTKHGAFGMGLSKVVSGSWVAVAIGWLQKISGVWILHRVLANADFGGSNPGLPAGPYGYDTWTATSLAGPWTASPNTPTGNQRMAFSGVGSVDHLPGSANRRASGDWVNFTEVSSGGGYGIAISTAANPDGPYVAPSSGLVADGSTTGFETRVPENARVFPSARLGCWVGLVNLIATSGFLTDRSGIGYGASTSRMFLQNSGDELLLNAAGELLGNMDTTNIASWGSAAWRMSQNLGPLDTTGFAVGVQSHLTGPEGALIEGPHGEVPIVYDADPTGVSPGYHQGRSIRMAVLEPSTNGKAIAQNGNLNTYTARQPFYLADFVMEFTTCVTAQSGSGIGFRVEFRMDSTGDNGYLLRLDGNGLALEKSVSGSVSTLATRSGSLTWEKYMGHRIKISAVGNVIVLTLDGEEQVSYTDSSSPFTSGTHIGLVSQGAALSVHNLSIRKSDTLTISGLTPGATVVLRSYGEFPVDTFTADGSGNVDIVADHWPHQILEIDGEDVESLDGALWGGDVWMMSESGSGPDPDPRLSAIFAGRVH